MGLLSFISIGGIPRFHSCEIWTIQFFTEPNIIYAIFQFLSNSYAMKLHRQITWLDNFVLSFKGIYNILIL